MESNSGELGFFNREVRRDYSDKVTFEQRSKC